MFSIRRGRPIEGPVVPAGEGRIQSNQVFQVGPRPGGHAARREPNPLRLPNESISLDLEMDTASSLILNNHVMASVNPLQQVFDKAKREFKSELPARVSFDSLLAAATIDDVYDVAEKYQKEQQKTSKLRHLQRIQPLLDRLKEYAGVIEVFVQVKPDVLALLWGPIKLLLLWTSVWNQGFDAVVKTMERIGELLPSFSDVVRHFIDVDRIRDILGLFYRDILDFYVVMVQFFSLPRRSLGRDAHPPRSVLRGHDPLTTASLLQGAKFCSRRSGQGKGIRLT